MSNPRVLMVDDNEDILAAFSEGLTNKGFDVITAASVSKALRLIADEPFDVPLTDLHMPNPGDGFTIVTAMRHTHPKAITMVVSGFPALPEAMAAILLEADQVIPKPVSIASLAELIKAKIANPAVHVPEKVETVAAVLEHEATATIQHWMGLVEKNEELASVKLESAQRMGHLPNLIADLVERLRLPRTEKALNSAVAQKHGQLRLAQGYTVPMVVEESRLLQMSVFHTLHKNLRKLDFSTVLLDVMSIADEIDSQLKQALRAFTKTKTANTVG